VRYVTFSPRSKPEAARLGVWADDGVIEIGGAGGLPSPMLALIEAGPLAWEAARAAAAAGGVRRWAPADVRLHAPVARPPSLRDFYAFEAHVKAAFAIRRRAVPEEWYAFPAFYFGNAASVRGPDDAVAAPPGSEALDYELEVACVIGTGGRDIPASEAPRHIFGYAVLNDWSARDIQRTEMRVGLGPAKGKDFATSLGPWLVTPDELADRAEGRPGVYRLTMSARVNGVERSRGDLADLYYSFGEMIARASAGVDLEPGAVLGSGTVGSGCLLELTEGKGPWLQPGDVIELEVERLGVLRNTVARGE